MLPGICVRSALLRAAKILFDPLALPADAEKLLEERKEQCKEQQKGHHNDGGDARKSKDAKGVAEGSRVCMHVQWVWHCLSGKG